MTVTGDLRTQAYVGGGWRPAESGLTFDVENPATEETIASVPAGGIADADAAVEAARRAFDEGPWGRSTPSERRTVLLRFAEELERRRSEITDTVIAEAGATRTLCDLFQVAAPLEHLPMFADLAARPTDTALPPMTSPVFAGTTVRRVPRGVVVGIAPFNFPFFMGVTKVAQALAAGCTIVLKPSELTPLSALHIAAAAEAADVPAGVINVVTGGPELGRRLVEHPGVDAVSFTGSTAIGRAINEAASTTFKKVVLELGGKSAALVMPDADPSLTALNIAGTAMLHQGQACGALTRVLVPDSLHDAFLDALTGIYAFLTPGDPSLPTTTLGPLISAQHRERVEGYVTRGIESGARLVCGGTRPTEPERGYWALPTILDDVDNRSEVAQEEIFGPVTSVVRYRDVEHAVDLANDSRYGLAGCVFATDRLAGLDVARRIRAGSVGVNVLSLNPEAPYGGFKESGTGRDFGPYGVDELTDLQTLYWN